MIIYLAGPMHGCSDEESYGWRNQIQERLPDDECILPPRLPLEDYEAVVNGDLDNVQRSDLVIINAWKPSWGSAMEVYDAWMSEIPVMVIWPFEETVHPWLQYMASCVVHNIEAAIMAIEHYPLTKPR